MEQVNVSLFKILAVLSTPFWMALLIKPRPKQSRSSISRFRPHCQELIRRSLTLATHTVTPANGKSKQKTYQNVSSRISRSSKETRPERHWLPLVRNYNSRIRTARKHSLRSAFLLPFLLQGSPPILVVTCVGISLLSPTVNKERSYPISTVRNKQTEPGHTGPGSEIDI